MQYLMGMLPHYHRKPRAQREIPGPNKSSTSQLDPRHAYASQHLHVTANQILRGEVVPTLHVHLPANSKNSAQEGVETECESEPVKQPRVG